MLAAVCLIVMLAVAMVIVITVLKICSKYASWPWEKHSAERATWHHVRRTPVGLARSAQAPNGMRTEKSWTTVHGLPRTVAPWLACMHTRTYVYTHVHATEAGTVPCVPERHYVATTNSYSHQFHV
jgi:hypothetical protein